MEKFIKILNTLACFFSGMILSSLCITGSDVWKFALPMCLICITFRNIVKQ